MTDNWDANIYSKFLTLRTKPARDLLLAVPEEIQPNIIYDLGCGPGNSTNLLKQRWPKSKITGIDSSDDMLKKAKSTYKDIDFIISDIQNLKPSKKIDLLFANASLQWIPNHQQLFPKLLKILNNRGFFAAQLPNNFHQPSHQTIIQALEKNQNWKHLTKNLFFGKSDSPIYSLTAYYDLLVKSGGIKIKLWETEYFQEVESHNDIFEWIKGTGLRPVFCEMDEINQKLFKECYIETIKKKYPMQTNNKVLLPYKRIFMTCVYAK